MSEDLVLKGPMITLTYKVAAQRRQELLEFLRSARQTYEEPGGIRIGLFESIDDPGLFCEVVAYASPEAYEVDQARVEQDERMKELLAQWHAFIDGPLHVRRLRPVKI